MKRALLVGVDEYVNFNPLGGCVNDVHALEPLLTRNEDGTVNFDCQVRIAANGITRDLLLRDLQALLGPGWASPLIVEGSVMQLGRSR